MEHLNTPTGRSSNFLIEDLNSLLAPGFTDEHGLFEFLRNQLWKSVSCVVNLK